MNSVEKCYMVPAGDAKDLQIFNSNIWETFEEFKSKAFSVWTTTILDKDSWIDSTCNCPAFMKQFIRKHILGIAIRLRYCSVPQEAKNIPIGSKGKNGRPATQKIKSNAFNEIKCKI